VQARLRENGVPTAVYYPKPLHRQPAYAAVHDGVALPVSEGLATRIMALPIHPDLSEAAATYICEQVVESMRAAA
jgi:UDP-2-acetamido-2-deoxy-ribo-hexuluronate aminotransferase